MLKSEQSKQNTLLILNFRIMKQFFFLLFIFSIGATGLLNSQTLTGEQQETRNRLRQASLIVAELMKNPNAKTVILAGIKIGYYPDESVKFNDLLNPATSPVFSNNPYLGGVSMTSFANAFQAALQSKQYLNSSDYTAGYDLGAFLIGQDVQVYFPYSEDFTGTINPVVTFHPIDNEDVNDGFVLNANGLTYQTVQVTDAIAKTRPVFIINFYEGGPVGEGGNSGSGGIPVEPRGTGGMEDCNIPPLRMSVQIKELKFMSQWDGIFAGGPDFVFARGELAYNSTGTQVVTTAPQVRINMKRSWRGGWRGVNTLWDQRWEFQQTQFEELEQFFALYEDDSNSSTTVSLGGSVKADVKIPQVGGVEQNISANVSHTITTADQIVYNQQLDRCYLITTNSSNLGLGTWQNLCVRGVGGSSAVYWTLQLIPW